MPEPVNTVRRTLLNARYERFAVRIGGPDASMKGQWPTLLLAAVVVFACFFAIGRLGAGGAAHGEPSSALRAFSSHAAIPGGLRGDSPIAGSVPSAIAPRPARSAVSPAASASSAASAAAQSQPLAERTSGASTPSSSTQVAPVAQPAPVKTSAPVTANPQPSSSAGRPSSSSGGAHPSSPSGGSFDSSE